MNTKYGFASSISKETQIYFTAASDSKCDL